MRSRTTRTPARNGNCRPDRAGTRQYSLGDGEGSIPPRGTEGAAWSVARYKHGTVRSVNLLSVDPDAPEPPFEQVRAQIATAIQTGDLAPATRLPTVRQLAADLGLAVNTVARSYRELEIAGLIETRGRNGTFVAGAPSESRRLAVRAAREFTRRMRDLGIGDAESLAIVRREIEAQAAPGRLGLPS